MPDQDSQSLTASQLREKALARWENEGGAVSVGKRRNEVLEGDAFDVPPLTDAELSQLHIRVIALEGLLTALVAEASDRQIKLAREMAIYISPRAGFTQHPLTMRAATQMIDLLERAERFRMKAP